MEFEDRQADEQERRWIREAIGDTPWPDLSQIKVHTREEPRDCVRCKRPMIGEQCPHCRAKQSSYRA